MRTVPILFLFHLAFVSCLDFRIIHKFSDEARGLGLSGQQPPPVKGSIDYYRLLHKHDLTRHGRRLLTGNNSDTIVLLQGNYTEDLGPRFGGLHYTILDIGSPNVSFLVALDTGSDLLWVPCDCIQCAPVSRSEFPELRKQLTTFSTKNSTSSKPLTCSSEYCPSNSCTGDASVCPYTVRYLSENTSTSGKLVQDVIHLLRPHNNTPTTASIVFGCGERQTGLFLQDGAPNGLLGLGPGDISLPSLLAKDGLINDTFSMCFDNDGSGRLLFGDRGAKTQQTTPFYLNARGLKTAYDVAVEAIVVGGTSIRTSFSALFDTGTTLTYLPSEVYSAVAAAFDSEIQLRRLRQSFDPYEFCYEFSGDPSQLQAPSISITFNEGGNFTALGPYVLLVDSKTQQVGGLCLALLESNIPIIGQNFMVGYRLSFDRELSRLGWAPSSCYHLEDSATFATPPPVTSFNRPDSKNRDETPFVRSEESSGQKLTPTIFLVLSSLLLAWHFCKVPGPLDG